MRCGWLQSKVPTVKQFDNRMKDGTFKGSGEKRKMVRPTNTYHIKKMYFDIGYSIESISELAHIPEKKIRKILGINNSEKNGDDENGKKRKM